MMTPDPSNPPRKERRGRRAPPTIWVAPETLMSLVIAFALALMFRAVVIEPFMIPTGSMAPTLLGEHVRMAEGATGIEWPVDGRAVTARNGPQELHSPVTGSAFATPTGTLAGDRVLVQKYIFGVREPERFEVVVLINPLSPDENFIKRLIGLPGEQVALVDGDVFVRTPSDADTGSAWTQPGWSIARKPERTQRALWRTIYDTSRAPIGTEGFRSPWTGDPERTRGLAGPVIDVSPGPASTIAWDHEWWPITDAEPYNETRPPSGGATPLGPISPPIGATNYPTGDLRLRAGIETNTPWRDGLDLSFHIDARGHEFRATILDARARLSMRAEGEESWTLLDAGDLGEARLGRVRDVEFWHVDQALWLFVDGRLVAGGPSNGAYAWDVAQRIDHALPLGDLDSALAIQPGLRQSVFSEPSIYARSSARLSVSSPSTVRLHRLALDRDLHYSPFHNPGAPHGHLDLPLGTHPERTPTLRDDQVFVLGDNSPASSDSRYWPEAHRRVRAAHPDAAEPGLVPTDLLIGRAFAVYFPAVERRGLIPVPDFGRMRWIE